MAAQRKVFSTLVHVHCKYHPARKRMPAMAENGSTKRRRAQRRAEVAARQERLRKRNADQLAAQETEQRSDRDVERRVKTALKAYAKADVSIRAVEQNRDERAANLVQQIKLAREVAQRKIDQLRQQQAMAVWQIRDAGRTVDQIAELLELPLPEAHRLLATGPPTARSNAAATTGHDPRGVDPC